MLLPKEELLTAKVISIGLALTTITVLTIGTDPVNVSKFFILGITSFAALGTLFYNNVWRFLARFKLPLVVLAIFTLIGISTLFTSDAPIAQSMYGVYGRNNGWLLYCLLSLIFVSVLTFRSRLEYRFIVYALALSGGVNVVYGLWVFAFGDFVGWTNPYGNLLGTLGNPNFAGSFFGIFSSIAVVGMLAPNLTSKIRIGSGALFVLVLVCTIQTQAVQGKVLLVSTLAIVGFFRLRDLVNSAKWMVSYVAVVFCGALFAILGALQIGPLTSLIYKGSVSLRGEYWYAGWITGQKNPLTGVGFDSYGDWFRRSRRESSLEFPGVNTVSNTAHNVFLDLFSFGGWPILALYSTLVMITFLSVLKIIRLKKQFDPVIVILVSSWSCYMLQSTISINQIALAMWGWALGAAIIGYANLVSQETDLPAVSKVQKKSSKRVPLITPSILALTGSLLGVCVSLPPLSADVRWKNALDSRDVAQVEKALKPSYFNPQNTFKFNSAVALFETSNLPNYAHKYALAGVRFNPNNYESWRNLYQIRSSSESDRSLALRNMKRLDPLNPDVSSR